MTIRYRERLYAPLSWWLVALVFGSICGWIMFVAGTPTLGIAAGLVGTFCAGLMIWSYGALGIRIDDRGLHVGRAHLPVACIGAITTLDRVSLRESLGAHADARAWLATRPYVDCAIRVDVDDPSDPAPYWLLSTRHPEAVAAGLELIVGHTGTKQ